MPAKKVVKKTAKKKALSKPMKKDMDYYAFKRGREDYSCGYSHNHDGKGIYFLGFLGALIYYLMHSSGFWMVVLSILKALVWPVFVVMKILGM